MFEVAHTADTAVAAGAAGPVELTPLVKVDMSVFIRGVNALKATRLLLTESYWEFAAGIVRQLFELVVNVEHLRAQDNQEAAATRYAAFGLLQAVQARYADVLYAQSTGRPVDLERLNTLESALGGDVFDEFRTITRSGDVRWAANWSGLTTKALAERSPNPLRAEQYKQLFSTWSEQAHGAPGALAPDLLGSPVGRTVELMLTADEARVSEIATMAVVLFLELWKILPAGPQLDEARVGAWVHDLAMEAAAYVSPNQLLHDDPLQQMMAAATATADPLGQSS